MNAKVSTAFLGRDTDAQLVVDSGRILVAMTNNPNYPSPQPALADIEAARNNFIAAVNALDGAVSATVARDQQRDTLVDLLRNLSLYVQLNCNGDLTTLLSSGHSAQHERKPAGQLSTPSNLRLRRPQFSGQIQARCDVVRNANAYQWRLTTTLAPTSWTVTDPTTAANTTLTDLTPGVVYIVQARAIGSKGATDWSDAATLMAV